MAVPVCATLCVRVCVWRNGHKWKFFTCSAAAVGCCCFCCCYWQHTSSATVATCTQPRPIRVGIALASRAAPCEKKTAQSQSEKPQTKAKVVMPRNGLNVQPVGRQCRRADRHGHGQWQGQGQGQRQQQQYKQRTLLAQGGARCVYAMHTLAYDN